MLKAYERLNSIEDEYSVSIKFSKEILSLPIYPELEKAEIEYIVNQIKSFYS